MDKDIGKNKSALSSGNLAWLPIPLTAALIALLWAADLRIVWHLGPLNWFIHYGSATIAIVFIVIPAARIFLVNGQTAVLMLSCGVLASEVGVFAMPIGYAHSTSSAFAIYNILALFSALCHFAGVTITSLHKVRLKHSAMWLLIAYAAGLVVAGLVIWASLIDRVPLFFIDSHGGTLLRIVVVSVAVFFFSLTASLLWQTNRRSASAFLYWYALGLALVAVGLAGSMLITMKDSLLQWATRSTQFLGMIYMCVAVLSSTREDILRDINLDKVEEAWQEKVFLSKFRKHTLLGLILRYGLAILVVAGAMAIRFIMTAWVGPGLPVYLTFYPAIIVAAIVGGFGPGLVATVTAGFVAGYWILPPVGELYVALLVDRVGLVIFITMGLVLSLLAELYRRNRTKLSCMIWKSSIIVCLIR